MTQKEKIFADRTKIRSFPITIGMIIMICVIRVLLGPEIARGQTKEIDSLRQKLKASGQGKTFDSLKFALKNATHDTTRCNIISLLANKAPNSEREKYYDQLKILSEKNSANGGALKNFYLKHLAVAFRKIGVSYVVRSDYAKALEYFFKSLKLSDEIGDNRELGKTLGNIANVYSEQGDYTKTLEYNFKSLKLSEKIGDPQTAGRTLGNIANVYKGQANYPKALEYSFKALKLNEEVGDKRGIGATFGNIANVYLLQADYTKALEYYFKGLKFCEEEGDKQYVGKMLSSIATAYNYQADYQKALEYYLKALKMLEEVGDKQSVGGGLCNIANLYFFKRDYLKALEYHFKSLKIGEEIRDKQMVGTNLSNIGGSYINLGKYKDAEVYLKKGLLISTAIGAENLEKDYHKNLSILYEKTIRPALALEHYKKFIALRDTIFSQENSKKIMRSEMDHDYEKKKAVTVAEHKMEVQNQKLITDEKNKKQNIIIGSVAAGLILVMIFAGFVFRSLRITAKQKQIIELKNNETEHQKKEIEGHQKDILDSIHYAKRIQMAQIPSEKRVGNILKRLMKL